MSFYIIHGIKIKDGVPNSEIFGIFDCLSVTNLIYGMFVRSASRLGIITISITEVHNVEDMSEAQDSILNDADLEMWK